MGTPAANPVDVRQFPSEGQGIASLKSETIPTRRHVRAVQFQIAKNTFGKIAVMLSQVAPRQEGPCQNANPIPTETGSVPLAGMMHLMLTRTRGHGRKGLNMVRQCVGLLLAGSLAGCVGYNPGYTGANQASNAVPKATPSSAMASADRFSPRGAAQKKPYTLAASQRRTEISAARAEQTIGDGARQPPSQGQDLKPFTEEWWERERAIDARLRARINICRGC